MACGRWCGVSRARPTRWRSSSAWSSATWCGRDDLASRLLFLVQELLVAPVGILLAAVDDFGVALQGVEVGVAQHLLNQTHVAARDLEERRGRRVTGHVRGLE